MAMGLPATLPALAPPQPWNKLGDVLQHIAAHGDDTFLNMVLKQSLFHLALLEAARSGPR